MGAERSEELPARRTAVAFAGRSKLISCSKEILLWARVKPEFIGTMYNTGSKRFVVLFWQHMCF